jgi:acyl-CoA synthetase (AMP-forming)/AMP-acid ligase II
METNLSEERIRESTRQGLWRDLSLESYLDRRATERPDKTVMVDGRARYTYAELARTVERVAHGLRAHGAGPGRVIAGQLPNWSEFALLFLAASRLGAVINPIPPTYRASELRFMVSLLEASVVVIPETFRDFRYTDMLAGLRAELPSVEHVFVARGAPGPGMMAWAALASTAWEARDGRRPLPGSDPNRVHEVVFTSGTTGEPKGVMHTPNTTLSTIYGVIERLDFSDRDVLLMSSTLGHQTGYLYGFCLNFLLGAKDVIIRGGENIPVAEVENVLFGHPKVAGIAIVAMPDPRLQERACAFVIPAPGETLTLSELVAYLDAQQLSKQKFPERIEIVSEFPMTPSGKIQKYRLRQLIKEKIGAETGRLADGRRL